MALTSIKQQSSQKLKNELQEEDGQDQSQFDDAKSPLKSASLTPDARQRNSFQDSVIKLQHRPYTLVQRLKHVLYSLLFWCTGRDFDQTSLQHIPDTADISMQVQVDAYGRRIVAFRSDSQAEMFQASEKSRHNSSQLESSEGDGVDITLALKVSRKSVTSLDSKASSVWISLDSVLKSNNIVVPAHMRGLDAHDKSTLKEIATVFREYQRVIQKLPQPISRQYQVSRLLGWGGNGLVIAAVDRRLGQKVAIKLMPKTNFTSQETLVRYEEQLIPMEVDTLRRLKGVTGVAQYVQHVEGKSYFYLVMEHAESFAEANEIESISENQSSNDYDSEGTQQRLTSRLESSSLSYSMRQGKPTRCDAGSLFHLLQVKSQEVMQPFVYKPLFRQLITTYSLMVQRGFCYLDFKGENILVADTRLAETWKLRPKVRKFWQAKTQATEKLSTQESTTSTSRYKLCIVDFGMARAYSSTTRFQRYGTSYMSSPEALLQKEFDGIQADIWALGLILYSLASGGRDAFNPYENSVLQLVQTQRIAKLAFSEIVDDSTRLVIQRMLMPQVNQRASLFEVLTLTAEW